MSPAGPRALRALFLLVGFYLMGLGLLAAVLGIDWLLIGGAGMNGYYPLGMIVFSGVLIAPILRPDTSPLRALLAADPDPAPAPA